MTLYLFIIFVLSVKSILFKENYKKNKKDYFLWIIIFVAAFKYKIGTDWYHYQNFYEDIIPEMKFSYFFQKNIGEYFGRYPFERIYGFLNYIFYKLGFNYEFFQGIVMSFLLFKVFKFIKEKSNNYYYAILILFMTSFFQYMFEPFFRQLIAIGLFLIAIDYLQKNNKIKYIIIILLATCFHKSACIMLILLFSKKLKFNNKKLIFFISFMYIVVFNMQNIIAHIPFISSYLSYFNTMKTPETHTVARNTNIIFDLLKIALAIFKINLIFFSYRRSKKYNKEIENMAIAFCVLSIVSLKLPIIERIQGYFMIPYVISLSNLMEFKISEGYKITVLNRILMIALMLYSLLFFVKNIGLNERNAFRYNNYKNYIFEMKRESSLEKYQKRKERDDFFFYWWNLKSEK
ncbi:EpsG family protein [Fusobacterium polymorphum]|uniref:EpsG family protein n=1 Tax=Fusobacterium nucleatum subsp. polymorphum TaxID=76857 RepID=UPI00300996E7